MDPGGQRQSAGLGLAQAASALTLLGGASFECKVGRTVKRAQGVADAHGDGELFARPGAAHVNCIEQVDVQPCSRCTDTAWMLGRRGMSAADFKAIFKRQNDGFVAAVREINDRRA